MQIRGLNGAAAATMAVALGLAASACSTPAPGGSSALSGSEDPAARLEALVALDRRVAAVGFRLTTASVDLCASRRDVAGWTLHAANQYSDALRPVAEARFGLDGDLPGVLAVADDSPAARAGLSAGDLLVRVNGEDLEAGHGSGHRPMMDWRPIWPVWIRPWPRGRCGWRFDVAPPCGPSPCNPSRPAAVFSRSIRPTNTMPAPTAGVSSSARQWPPMPPMMTTWP